MWLFLLVGFFFAPVLGHGGHDECVTNDLCDTVFNHTFARILHELHHVEPMPYPSVPPLRKCQVIVKDMKLKQKSRVCKKYNGRITTVKLLANNVILKCNLQLLPIQLVVDVAKVTNAQRQLCLIKKILQEMEFEKKMKFIDASLMKYCGSTQSLFGQNAGIVDSHSGPGHSRHKRFLPGLGSLGGGGNILPGNILPFNLPLALPNQHMSLPDMSPPALPTDEHDFLKPLDKYFDLQDEMLSQAQKMMGLEGTIHLHLDNVYFRLTQESDEEIGNVTVNKISAVNVRKTVCNGSQHFEKLCNCIGRDKKFLDFFLELEHYLFPCYFKGTYFATKKENWSWHKCRMPLPHHHHHPHPHPQPHPYHHPHPHLHPPQYHPHPHPHK